MLSGAETASINPFTEGRGFELKCQLVRATIAATEAAWNVDPRARMYQNEPMFNVIAQPDRPQDTAAAEGYRQLMFQTWDLLSGRIWPQIGGDDADHEQADQQQPQASEAAMQVAPGDSPGGEPGERHRVIFQAHEKA